LRHTDLAGALVNMKLVTTSNVAKLHERLQRTGLWNNAGLIKAPDADKVKEMIAKERLVVWSVCPITGGAAIGFVALAFYLGTPFVWVDFFAPPDVAVLRDCAATLAPAFFRGGDDPLLMVYVPRAAEPLATAAFDELGFDVLDEETAWNPNLFVAYVMLRSTFVAYYEDGDATDLA
jgi:hypothetical protein